MYTSQLIQSWCGQDFYACLGLLGPVIDTLHLEGFGGDVLTSESLRTCGNLRCLTLDLRDYELEVEHLEAGLQHLRSAAITPLTLPITWALSTM